MCAPLNGDEPSSGGPRCHPHSRCSPEVDDDEVLAIAVAADSVLLTLDKDFGELVFRFGMETKGVVLVRLPHMPPVQRNIVVSATIAELEEQLSNSFTVIAPKETRIRPVGRQKDD